MNDYYFKNLIVGDCIECCEEYEFGGKIHLTKGQLYCILNITVNGIEIMDDENDISVQPFEWFNVDKHIRIKKITAILQ